MGRLKWAATAPVVAILAISLVSCSGSSSGPAPNPAPITIVMNPHTDLSVELGNTQTFTVTATDKQGRNITNYSFVSSNTAVVTVSSGGLACAGTWDSLTNPVTCTPGTVGVAQITAVANGVSSAPATIHVHQHIDSIAISPVTAPTTPCFSKDTTFDYQVNVFSRGLDITSTVGNITWQTFNTAVLGLSTTATGLTAGQVQATAKQPGLTNFFASVGGATSLPMSFTTCPVKSIDLVLTDTGDTSFTAASGAKAVTATVTDSLDTEVSGVTLTWSSSQPAAMTAASTGTGGSITATGKAGSSTILASCTPPGCNAGFQPSRPVYPTGVITGTITGTSTTPPAATVWVSSTGCGTDDNCVTKIVPINTPDNTVATGADLPATPNSMVFDRQSVRAYLGTNKSLLNTKGLTILTLGTGATISSATKVLNVPGKVLAVSSDGRKIALADAADTNQGLILTYNGDPTTSLPTITQLPATGFTGADFSPDSFKAYALAGNKLFSVTSLDALKTFTLPGAARDVSFLPNASFAYFAGGAGSPAITVRTTCNDAQSATIGSSLPAFIKTVPNNQQVLAVRSPGVDLIQVSTNPVVGCPPTATNTRTFYDLGQGAFLPTQLIVADDSSRAYILASNLSAVLIFDIQNHSTSAIQLAGNAFPVQASLSSDGKKLYVIGHDPLSTTVGSNTVHVLDTVSGTDTAQISFPDGVCHQKDSTTIIPCDVDLIAARP